MLSAPALSVPFFAMARIDPPSPAPSFLLVLSARLPLSPTSARVARAPPRAQPALRAGAQRHHPPRRRRRRRRRPRRRRARRVLGGALAGVGADGTAAGRRGAAAARGRHRRPRRPPRVGLLPKQSPTSFVGPRRGALFTGPRRGALFLPKQSPTPFGISFNTEGINGILRRG